MGAWIMFLQWKLIQYHKNTTIFEYLKSWWIYKELYQILSKAYLNFYDFLNKFETPLE